MKYIKTIQNKNLFISKDRTIRTHNGEFIIPRYDTIKYDNTEYIVEELYMKNFYGNSEYLSIVDYKYNYNSKYYVENSIFLNGEEFKNIPKFKSYYINKYGLIYSNVRDIFIKRTITENGYLVSTITDSVGYRRPMKVHRLVYLSWVSEIDKDKVIDHLDGNKCNPYLNNLEMITYEENTYRSLTMGLQKNKRWNREDIELICKLLERNRSLDDICEVFKNVSNRRQVIFIIHKILNKEMFKEITTKYNISYNHAINKKDRKLTVDQVLEIRKLYENKILNIKDLSIKFKVSTNTISNIVKYKKWKSV